MNIEQAAKKLIKFEQEIEQATQKTNELSAELKLLEKEMKEKFEVTTEKEAQEKLKQLDNQINENEKIFINLIEELEDEFTKFQE